MMRDADGKRWTTVWRLVGGENDGEAFTRLTRHHNYHGEICNLGAGQHVLYLYMFRQGEDGDKSPQQLEDLADEEVRRSKSMGSKSPANSAMRNVLKTATFGQFGVLEVHASFKVRAWTKGQTIKSTELFQHTVALSDDQPVVEIRFTVDEAKAPAVASLSLVSTSTVTNLNVAAQLNRILTNETAVHDNEESTSLDTDAFEKASKELDTTKRELREMRHSMLVAAIFIGFILGASSMSSGFIFTSVALGILLVRFRSLFVLSM